MTCCYACGISVLPIKECNSRKSGKSMRTRMRIAREFGGKQVSENLITVCRGCDSILEKIGNCCGAVKIYIHLGEHTRLNRGSSAGMGYIRQLEKKAA